MRETIAKSIAGTETRRGLPAAVAYRLGRGARAAQTLASQDIGSVTPLKAGVVVAGIWGAMAAITNTYRYKRDKISKKRAFVATASESVGVGLSASLGLIAGNTAKMAFMSASATSVLTIATSAIVTAGFKSLWDRTISDLINRIDGTEFA